MDVNRRLKVLISAYTCNPYHGSESAVGWGFVSALAQYHDLWVIVEEEKCRADIEHFQADNPHLLKSVQFLFLPKKRNRRLRSLWPPSYYWYYRRWHKGAFVLAQQLHQTVRFDLAHQLTMVGFREPGYLWKLGIPFVWGPIGGMGFFPWRFLPVVGIYGAIYYLGYNLFNWLHMNFLSRPKQAARAATAVSAYGLITATPENRDYALRNWSCSSILLSEVGLPLAPIKKARIRNEGEPLQIVWAGLHIPRKALNLLLKALALLPANINWQLHVLGEGPRTAEWIKQSHSLGLDGNCCFHGWLTRDETLSVMSSAHLMVITSLRDLTSTVTIEALALGLPVACLKHCGFNSAIDESCGITVPVTTPTEVINGIAEAIICLERDESLRSMLANGALLRAQNFSWDKKAEIVNGIYQKKIFNSAALDR